MIATVAALAHRASHALSGSAAWRRTRETAGGLADLLLPRVCVVCERSLAAHERGVVCGRCWTRLDAIPFPQCTRCGHPHIAYSCRWCDLLPPFVRAVRSVCWAPSGSGGGIVHALKYEGWRVAAEGMAERMARLAWPRDVIDERTALVPVPLSPARQRERGFNQSELIARALASHWRIPVWTDLLDRQRNTETQTRLTPGDRLRNVAGAFDVSASAAKRLRGAHFVLVDDVVTTAATLNACADALMRNGARIISYVTFGRARSASDRPLS
jgi:ComF family protein